MNTRLPRTAAALGGLAAVVWLAGCGGNDQVAVRGSVSLDGKPVANGMIHFNPADTKARNAGALVKNGAYEIPAERGPVPGAYSVAVYWPEPTGKKIPNPDPYGEQKWIDDARELMPAKFNTQTTLSADFRGGENVVNFDLTSK